MSVTETLREERNQRELAKCKTPKQQAAFRLEAAGGRTPYVATRTGKNVVRAFKKYVTTMDPQAIDKGLYEWSIYDGPGDIAHYNLHGFRSVYSHPALYLELLLFPWLRRERQYRSPSVYVYTDGMTTLDITDEIEKLANQWKARVLANFSERKRASELAEAEELASRWGFKLTREEG